MKSKFYPPIAFFIFLFTTMIPHQAKGQCAMTRIPMEVQIRQSDLVVEGEVTSKRTIVTDDQKNIYTAYTISVTRIFKGDLVRNEIELIELGGSTEEMFMHVEPSISLPIGQAGTFILAAPRSANMRSLHFEKPTYIGFASTQSVFKYNWDRTEVSNVFKKSTYSKWYPSLTRVTGKEYTRIRDLKPLPSSQRSLLLPVIQEIGPSIVTAGTGSTFEIDGENFGETPGEVYFLNPDDGGQTWVLVPPVYIQTWTDNIIEVLVPGNAGSGHVRVVVNNQEAISQGSVQITYSEQSYEVDLNNVTWMLQTVLRKNNPTGSILFQFNTNFSNNLPARRSFLRAFDNWRCALDINYKMGGVTNISTSGNDNINVISFDTNDPLGPGVNARTSTSGPICWNSNYLASPVLDIDIIFATTPTGTTWQFGPTQPEIEVDFESVALHELGHTSQLGHVLEPDHIMYPFLDPGEEHRTAHPDDILGGIDERLRAVLYPTYCTYEPLKNYIANKFVDVSATNTVQSGDSWATAYSYLQDAILAPFNNICFDTLFVAQGKYYPDEGWFQANNNSQFVSFDFTKPMICMGGYPAGGGIRNIENNPTILSGDVDNDNILDVDNALNVVKLDANVTLDGVVIEHGYADANGGTGSVGAGLTNNADCTLRNIIFRKNKARGHPVNLNGKGGAIYNAAGTLNLYNSLFYQNEATQNGNAISVAAGLLNAANCTFVNNGGPTVNTVNFISGANILRNSLFWHNNTGNDVVITSPATLLMNYVMLEETQMPANATGFNMMFGRNPLFINEAMQNYRIDYCSPAMNTAWNAYNPTTLDVAGNARIQGGSIDVGAYESTYASPPNQVTNTSDTGPGSLRTIVSNICEYSVVSFIPGLSTSTLQMTSGPIVLNKELTIFGAPNNTMTITAGGTSHIFDISAGKNVFLTNLSLVGGASQLGLGNCVKNYGTLNLNNVKMQSQVGTPQTPTLANFGTGQVRMSGTVMIK